VRQFLNARSDVLAEESSSPRAVAESVQYLLTQHFSEIAQPPLVVDPQEFSRRAMADVAFADEDERYYLVDVKTRWVDASFHMPNLTSIERLARLYENARNYFVLLMVGYSLDAERRFTVDEVTFAPIEHLRWNCLSIGALGWGQIQLVRMPEIDEEATRADWMIELAETALRFYDHELRKIAQRKARFELVRDAWRNPASP
jgi:hypothetical protein